MERGNVLVIGNSGVGKSTLINAVLGEERAKTGWGVVGTTGRLELYESENIPFRLIDTVGFEPSKESKAIKAVKKWSKNSAKEGHEDTQINIIWFCVDGIAAKLFQKTIENLSKATKMWGSVPVIVVITKSFAIPDRERNIEMVNNAFAKQKHSKNLRKVIPVVASTFVLNDSAFAAPEGITELIDATNELMPEGIKAGASDVAAFNLARKRALAQSLVGVSTTAAVVVGAVPIPFADALLLAPIEMAEAKGLGLLYAVGKNEKSKQFFNTIVEVGTVSAAAKTAISALKAIPGINIGASVLNAIIAGSIVAALGEGTIYAFEQVYLGKKTVEDIDWVRKVMESELSSKFIGYVKSIMEKITQNTDENTIAHIIADTFKNISGELGNNKM